MTSSLTKVLAGGTIRYSQVWEDHSLVVDALDVGPDDDVLSIASAGCNVLAMLAKRPRSLVAVDLNPAQTALVELKLRAIDELSLDEFKVLFGLRPGARAPLYQRVRPRLSDSARLWWDERPALLEEGIHRAGRLEAFFRKFSDEILPSVHPREVVEKMLSMDGGAEQTRYFEEVFCTPAFERAFTSYFTAERLASEGRDARQMRYVEELDVPRYLLGRLRWVSTALPTRSNPYLQSLFAGRYLNDNCAPPHLQPSVYASLRPLTGRVRIEKSAVDEALSRAAVGAFSKANLSDLFEYLSDEAAEDLFRLLGERLRPNGRLCHWNLFVPRSPGPAARARLRALSDLAAALFARDRSWFYRSFHVEEIVSR